MVLDDKTREGREYSLLITDTRLPDNPIVYVNQAFLSLTGYGLDEVLGRNCRFLQGPETDPASIRALSEAIHRGDEVGIDILNYRKDASPFWNRLRVRPMHDDDGEIVNYIGLQIPITADQIPPFVAEA